MSLCEMHGNIKEDKWDILNLKRKKSTMKKHMHTGSKFEAEMPGIEESVEGEKESPKSPGSPTPQHKVHASVPAVVLHTNEEEKDITERIGKLSQTIEKLKDQAQVEDYSSVVLQGYETEIKELELELEKERKVKNQMQQTIDQLNAAVSSLSFEVNKKNSLLQAIKQKPEDPIKVLKEIKESITKTVGERETVKEAVNEVQAKLQSKRLIYENPKQLAAHVLALMIEKQPSEPPKESAKEQHVEQLSALHEILAKNIYALDAGVSQHKSVIADQIHRQSEALKSFKNALSYLAQNVQYYKRRLSDLQFQHAKEVATLQKERAGLLHEKTQAMELVAEVEELRQKAAAAVQLQNQVLELEAELRKRTETSIPMGYGTGEKRVSAFDLERTPMYDPMGQAISSTVIGKTELEKLQHYRELIAKEKQIVEYSTQDLNRKKSEMTKLMTDLNSKNRKIRHMENELKVIKGRYYTPATGYQIAIVTLFCLVMLLIYSHTLKSSKTY